DRCDHLWRSAVYGGPGNLGYRRRVLAYQAVTNAFSARRAKLPDPEVRRTGARGGFVTGFLARSTQPAPVPLLVLVGGPTLVQARAVGWPAVADSWSGTTRLLSGRTSALRWRCTAG